MFNYKKRKTMKKKSILALLLAVPVALLAIAPSCEKDEDDDLTPAQEQQDNKDGKKDDKQQVDPQNPGENPQGPQDPPPTPEEESNMAIAKIADAVKKVDAAREVLGDEVNMTGDLAGLVEQLDQAMVGLEDELAAAEAGLEKVAEEKKADEQAKLDASKVKYGHIKALRAGFVGYFLEAKKLEDQADALVDDLIQDIKTGNEKQPEIPSQDDIVGVNCEAAALKLVEVEEAFSNLPALLEEASDPSELSDLIAVIDPGDEDSRLFAASVVLETASSEQSYNDLKLIYDKLAERGAAIVKAKDALLVKMQGLREQMEELGESAEPLLEPYEAAVVALGITITGDE
ncbi:MAG: hypothetical protein CSA97_05515 [Bacteroidetes bacterium]|nr:MAG: hypothetical protein CSA97_05515 [Bacteroidota bacterium]